MKQKIIIFSLALLLLSGTKVFPEENKISFDNILLLYNSQKYREVIDSGEKVFNDLQTDRKKSHLNLIMGLSYFYLENNEKAIEYLNKAKETADKNIYANYYLGIVYMKIKDYKSALKNFYVFIENSKNKDLIEVAKKHIERIEREAGVLQ